ncbi:SDR family NAD(P)-dependent oxidoreductase [Flavobacterium sp. 1355]|jgi:NAD(P)-dependent dehydrogenase (short-subunit alcohol dehydrogenase family)|uniref:SDR family NAD(P)-dependent oxidoreductase n=1 Tax=Flavobacterium sp. 1355 TaxID=2806571 RepID=UPI001AEA9B08|nr:SDR family NAD(P)-dependent oxidoreductase [Flavobacterium sp. 1355]MBP1223537.1 NAD(P)-dependent dehydrogenase (short-subunit alcohol dehydrogenase family) [Flavobacterium sp. 1355]
METKKVWFVTGASKGLGLILVQKLLANGYRVAATSRDINALTKEVGVTSDQFLPLEVDLVTESSVKDAVAKTINHFKTIDVVVNNAGYGQVGTLEELSDEESRRNFDINVFGLLNVIRNTMPEFRANKSGHFFNISSIGGYHGGFPGWGIYCSTKFAVAGLTEGLRAEAKAFDVNVTLVYPGYFRTSFLTGDSMGLPKNPIADYEEARQSVIAHQNEINGNQPGDPEKAVDALIQISNEKNPPLHLFLGEDAYNMANVKIKEVEADLEKWKSVTIATAF